MACDAIDPIPRRFHEIFSLPPSAARGTSRFLLLCWQLAPAACRQPRQRWGWSCRALGRLPPATRLPMFLPTPITGTAPVVARLWRPATDRLCAAGAVSPHQRACAPSGAGSRRGRSWMCKTLVWHRVLVPRPRRSAANRAAAAPATVFRRAWLIT